MKSSRVTVSPSFFVTLRAGGFAARRAGNEGIIANRVPANEPALMKRPACLRPALLLAALLAAFPALAQVVTPPGGRIGLEPPPGFTAATNFAGFENRATGSTIVITELPAEAFPDVRESFTGSNAAGALAARGVRLIGVEQPQGTIKDAVLVRAEQTTGPAPLDRLILVFPGPGFTGLITANRPRSAASSVPDTVLRKALLSVRASPTPVGDPVAALPFTFTEGPRLKVAQTQTGNSVVLDDKSIAKEKPRPLFVIPRGQDEKPATLDKERDAFALRLLSSLQNFRNVAIVRQAPVKMAGLDGVEIEASALNIATNDTGVVLQIVLYESNGYYRLLGFVPDTMREQYWPEFRAIAASFKPKR